MPEERGVSRTANRQVGRPTFVANMKIDQNMTTFRLAF